MPLPQEFSLPALKESFPRRRLTTPSPWRSPKLFAPKKKASSGLSSLTSAGTGTSTCSLTLRIRPGKLENYDYPEEEIAMALAGLPAVG